MSAPQVWPNVSRIIGYFCEDQEQVEAMNDVIAASRDPNFTEEKLDEIEAEAKYVLEQDCEIMAMGTGGAPTRKRFPIVAEFVDFLLLATA